MELHSTIEITSLFISLGTHVSYNNSEDYTFF
jgi:hypothetical protein